MPPNFEEMTNAQLKAYALAHRDEIEPLRVLFHRRRPDTEVTVFPAPKTKEEEQQQFELFQQILDKKSKQASQELEEKPLQQEKEMEERLRQKIEREVEEKLRQKIEKEVEEKLRQKIEAEKSQSSQT
ncbi:MAG: hypothetical protein KME26_25835 [Oscillatoria princeps RMCB-10]|jgi:hypothetical protein|nr:hypothetical protein [Oscillatoria princeps RMCB-10]